LPEVRAAAQAAGITDFLVHAIINVLEPREEDGMVTWVGGYVAATAALAVLVGIACRLGRFRPAVCHALWLVVLIKLLTPPVVSWPWSPAAMWTWQDGGTGTETGAGPALLRLVGAGMDAFPEPNVLPSGGMPVPSSADRVSPGEMAAYGLGALWLLGILVTVGIQGRRIGRFLRLVKSGQPVPDWLRQQAETLAKTLGVEVPDLLAVSDIPSALTWKARRACILAPRHLLEQLDQDSWRGILAHELAHLKRRDHWVGWLELAAACLWWWNPVLWWARRRLHVFAEMACDAWVVAILPERRREYAETLVRVVDAQPQRSCPAPVFGMGSGPAAAFERRLILVLREQVRCRTPRFVLVGMVLLAGLVIPGWSQQDASTPESGASAATEPNASSKADDLEKKLQMPVSLVFMDIHLEEILAFAQDSYDVNIVVDWRVVQPPKDMGGPRPGQSYVTDGMVRSLNVRDVTIEVALQAVLRPMNLAYAVQPGAIWVSTETQMAADAALPKPRLEDPVVEKKLNNPVSMEFENIHLSEVCEFISDSYNVNLVLDQRVVAPKRAPSAYPSAKPVSGEGFTTTGLIPQINVREVTLREAIEFLLRPLNLTFSVSRGVVWITSYEHIDTFGKTEPSVPPSPPIAAQAVPAPAAPPNESPIQSPAADTESPATRGIRLLEIGKYEEAKAEFETALQSEPGNESAEQGLERTESLVLMRDNALKRGLFVPRVLAIREPSPGQFSARIQTQSVSRWYETGEAFERYRLMEIAPGSREAALLIEPGNFVLRIKAEE
jgi:beta-lactamase regulating signal transducer with metallopeptidase domain